MGRRAALVLLTAAISLVVAVVLHQASTEPLRPEVELVTGSVAIRQTIPAPAPVAAVPEPAPDADPVVVHTEAKASGGSTATAVGESRIAIVEEGDTGSLVITNSGTATASTGGNTGSNVTTGPATAIGNRATVDIRR